jgi:hypothetical protein
MEVLKSLENYVSERPAVGCIEWLGLWDHRRQLWHCGNGTLKQLLRKRLGRGSWDSVGYALNSASPYVFWCGMLGANRDHLIFCRLVKIPIGRKHIDLYRGKLSAWSDLNQRKIVPLAVSELRVLFAVCLRALSHE